MSKSIDIHFYFELCRTKLKENKIDDIQSIYNQMVKDHHEYKSRFIATLPAIVQNNYLYPLINDGSTNDLVWSDWEKKNPDWKEKIKVSLVNNKVGSCIYWLKESLLNVKQS